MDNPALHQGRIRTKPHVEGQFAAHVYVSLIIERRSPLHNLLDEFLNSAKSLAPTLTTFWSQEEQIKKRELHISLSRPTYLRAHQREDLKKAVKSLSRRFPPYVITPSAANYTHGDLPHCREGLRYLSRHSLSSPMTRKQEHFSQWK